MKKYYIMLFMLMSAAGANLLGVGCGPSEQADFNKIGLTCCWPTGEGEGGGAIYAATLSGHTCQADDTRCSLTYAPLAIGQKIGLSINESHDFCKNLKFS